MSRPVAVDAAAPRRRGRLALASAALLLVALAQGGLLPHLPSGDAAVAAGSPAGDCPGSGDGWVRLTPPVGTRHLVALYADACALVAATDHDVYISVNGGEAWTRTWTNGGVVTALISEHAGDSRVLLQSRADNGLRTLFVSADGGRTFAASSVPGLAEADVRAAASGAEARQLVVVAGAHPVAPSPVDVLAPSGSVFTSDDAGSTFSPAGGQTVGAGEALAANPADPASLWLTGPGGPHATLWHSTDGARTFSPVALPVTGVATDLTYRQSGTGPALIAAGSFGLLQSGDDGQTWDAVPGAAAAVQGVRAFPGVDGRLLTLGPGGARVLDLSSHRSTTTTGLPSGCVSGRLAASVGDTPAFLVSCPTRRWYAMVPRLDPAQGSSASQDQPGQGSSDSSVASPAPMQVLQTYPLPFANGNSFSNPDGPGSGDNSGSIAFDGRSLWYLAVGDDGRRSTNSIRPPAGVVNIDRINARTGRYEGRLAVHVGRHGPQRDADGNAASISYDPRRNWLYLFTSRGNPQGVMKTYAIDLATGNATFMFLQPQLKAASNIGQRLAYDPASDGFLGIGENQTNLSVIDRQGHVSRTCDINLGSAAGHSTGGELGAAAIVAGGDGTAYIQLEDDATVVRVTNRCHLLFVGAHQRFDEALAEDDQAACDTQTFATPAVWLRDAALDRGTGTSTVSAYAVPGVYCPLATTLTVAVKHSLHPHQRSAACARLSVYRRFPIPHAMVSLQVAGQQIAYATTDSHGIVCAHFAAGAPGTEAVKAQFFGSTTVPQFLPSSGLAAVSVLGHPPVPLPPQVTSVVPKGNTPLPTAEIPVNAPPEPLSPVQAPAPATASQVQAQGQAQSQAQAQGQAQANLGIAVDPAEQPQLARQESAELRAVATSTSQGTAPLVVLGIGCVATFIAAAAAWRQDTVHALSRRHTR